MSHAIEVPIAVGELIDKITILEIKIAEFRDPGKLANAKMELDLLDRRRRELVPETAELTRLTAELKAVNKRIWDLEDDIRECERKAAFGNEFIKLARSIYRTNDERAAVKRQINMALGSSLIEEKSYTPY